ncbi:SDR family NAD(P)-dependent oxidoreductase [Nocardia terpenica]|uniref:SDR family NAD(P)-dependent oxidoreductase n=1 Tax=Nocardia terpenica TaxID=455432 RepID=A0A6G9Z0L4_9NOCA|nr:SDR family NAD(P)-dependent oxidoreductase [Nocardia terpenica]QIS19048.1 SDR family NAD(P)-dependent oxidoreductase [Nocardia terpenica]
MIEFRSAPARFADLRRPRGTESPTGRRVLVTDACSEVGRATAELLARRGAELLLVDRCPEGLAALADTLVRAGGRASGMRCDIASLADIDAVIAWVLGDVGSVDVLINNACRPQRGPIAQSLDRFRDYQAMMAVHYFGPLRLTLGLLPAMLSAGSGHVVNVGPWHPSAGPAPNFASYASAQAAWTTFGLCADAELSPHGIHVTAVHYPGAHIEPTDAEPFPVTAARWIETALHTRPARVEPCATRTPRGLTDAAPRSATHLAHDFRI